MMYSDKLVAVVKVNGRILREVGSAVYIPFGSDYSIQLKNLHTTKAKVGVTIDGQDVLDGCKILISDGETTELDGFLQENGDVKSKFRFIEKTEEISDFRGDRIDDGLIAITFEYEKEFWPVPEPIYYRKSQCFPKPPLYNEPTYKSCFNEPTFGAPLASCNLNSCNTSTNESGITVGGADSDQHFTQGHFGISDGEKHSIVIHLKGKTETNEVVLTPIAVQTKIQCTSCGRKWKSNNTFCSGCGTRLL